jgi:hypothetical protein
MKSTESWLRILIYKLSFLSCLAIQAFKHGHDCKSSGPFQVRVRKEDEIAHDAYVFDQVGQSLACRADEF